MAVKARIKRNTYYDSVTLMTASSAIGELSGHRDRLDHDGHGAQPRTAPR